MQLTTQESICASLKFSMVSNCTPEVDFSYTLSLEMMFFVFVFDMCTKLCFNCIGQNMHPKYLFMNQGLKPIIPFNQNVNLAVVADAVQAM